MKDILENLPAFLVVCSIVALFVGAFLYFQWTDPERRKPKKQDKSEASWRMRPSWEKDDD